MSSSLIPSQVDCFDFHIDHIIVTFLRTFEFGSVPEN